MKQATFSELRKTPLRLLIDEALEKKKVVIEEVSEGGSVPELS